jgi:hypothetical protein
MGSQSFNRAIVASQFGFGEDRMDLLVAGAAEKNYCEAFVTGETTSSAKTSMKTTRNKVMPCQLRGSSTTQCATSRFHRPTLHHLNMLAQIWAHTASLLMDGAIPPENGIIQSPKPWNDFQNNRGQL